MVAENIIKTAALVGTVGVGTLAFGVGARKVNTKVKNTKERKLAEAEHPEDDIPCSPLDDDNYHQENETLNLDSDKLSKLLVEAGMELDQVPNFIDKMKTEASVKVATPVFSKIPEEKKFIPNFRTK